MLFVVKNKNIFILNSENYTKSIRLFNNFYHSITNLTVYQRGVHYMGIKVFNNLPPYIKGILYIKMNVCLLVWNLYKSTFLNRSEPNFAHVSLLVWRRSYGMYGPTIFQLSHLFDLFCQERVPICVRKMAAGARVPR
jgi:hypothetical protein